MRPAQPCRAVLLDSRHDRLRSARQGVYVPIPEAVSE